MPLCLVFSTNEMPFSNLTDSDFERAAEIGQGLCQFTHKMKMVD